MNFYHYTKACYVLSSILSNRLKIATLESVNDPYEMMPSVKVFGAPEPFCKVRECMRDILKNTGMICLSATVENPTMWSHYADKHTGVAFEMYFSEKDLTKVEYPCDNERVVLTPEDFENESKRNANFERLIKTKADSWRYEEEYRWVFLLSDPKLTIDVEGHIFRAFPTEWRRVILGVDCSLSEGVVRKALDVMGFDDVAVVRARLSDTKFAVVVDPPK